MGSTGLFARENVFKALLGSTKELSKHPSILIEAISVRQTTLITKAMDCSLYELRVFARECMRNKAFSCSLIPSDYYVLNLPASQTKQIQITFPKYYDFCVALGVDIVTREKGLYRRQRNRYNDMRAVQIVGVEQIRRDEPRMGRRPDPQLLVFPGVGTPANGRRTPRICLLQSNATWSDNSWESSFVRSMDCPRVQSGLNRHFSGLSSNQHQAYDINVIIEDVPVFSVVWKSLTHAEIVEGSSDEFSLGLLRSTVSAVVLRGWQLTKDVDAIFTTLDDSGKLLTEQIVSPPVPEKNRCG